MKIAIIGSGNVGGALAQQWIKAGHHVMIGAKFAKVKKDYTIFSWVVSETLNDPNIDFFFFC